MNARWQDTPAAVFMRLLADLLAINLLVTLCSIPLFTIGASLSAMYAVLFQREQDEGMVAVLRTFFRAFVKNFGKATLLELIVVAVFGFAAGDIWFAMNAEGLTRSVYMVVGTMICFVGLTLFILAFTQQAIYRNSVAGYLKNSAALAFCAPAQLLLAIAAWILPWFFGFTDEEVLKAFGFFLMLWGFSFPAWVTVKLIRPVFAKTKQDD